MLNEKDLVKRCKEYDIKAQQELYERFARKMNAVCYYYTGSLEDAKDLLHEGFIKVFDKIKQYKGEGSLEGWIRRIMVNTAINFLNKKKSKPDSIYLSEEDIRIEEEQGQEENVLSAQFTEEEILLVVAQLPDEYRLIFNMFCLEQFSHKDISERLHIKEETCRSKLRRARQLLRKSLEKLYDDKVNKKKITFPAQND